MSCPEKIDDSGSSNYGSDFTPDEEDLLNDLLSQAVAEHATGAVATSPSIALPPPIEPIPAPQSPELADLQSLQPEALAALVTDIEDGIEPPVVRLPKVLGREGPRPPWRQSQQQRPGQAVRWSTSATGRSSPYAGDINKSSASPFGMLSHFNLSAHGQSKGSVSLHPTRIELTNIIRSV
jgi:exonuclease V